MRNLLSNSSASAPPPQPSPPETGERGSEKAQSGLGPRRILVNPRKTLGCLGLGLLLVLGLAVGVRQAMLWEGDDPYNRTEGWAFVERSVLRRAGWDSRACRCAGQRELVLRQAGGLETRATLYEPGARPTAGARYPGVILVHGNTALGRRLSTYRLLAEKLARRGFLVLAYDQLGFGQSDDPYGRGPELAHQTLGGAPMLTAAVEALIAAGAEPGELTLVGHSGGAIPVLQLADHPEVARIALLGPPRRVVQRSSESVQRRYFSERFERRYRFVYGHDVPEWLSPEQLDRGGPWALEDYLDTGFASGHGPVLLIDGALEPAEDLAYLEAFYQRLGGPKDFLRLEHADHYLNTAQFPGWVVYDRRVIHQLVDHLVLWIGSAP